MRATLRQARVLVWDAIFVRTPTEHSGPGLVHSQRISADEIFVEEYPVVSDETAEFVCGRYNEPISMTEAILYS